MPILMVKVSGKKSQELTRQIGELLMDLTSRILKKKRELLSEVGKNSFYFDIKITDETNTKDEKARYIREAYEGFDRLIGNLHEESYIYVQDVRATAYGFGGKTQEFRYHQLELPS
jgi:4-oxalocrotonate tautomerase